MTTGKVGMVFMDAVQEVVQLRAEITRLKNLLECSQRENYRNIEEKAEFLRDPVIGPILKLRSEVEGRKAHEADLLSALEETKGEMASVERTYGGLLDELEFKVAL